MNAYIIKSLVHNGFLFLDGPFAYARWLSRSDATPLTYAKAHAWAAVYGGEVEAA